MISVIIPTYNAKSNIGKLLTSLKNQSVDEKVEIVIIDSSSTDGTAELCATMDNVTWIQIPKAEFNHGHTRNQAAGVALGEILVFVTQDALPMNKQFLTNLIMPIKSGKAAATYGRQIARNNATNIEKLTRTFNYPNHDVIKSKEQIQELGIKTFFFTNVCSAIRKDVFVELGKFPDCTILNEDILFAYKLIMSGQKIKYVASAQVAHSHNYSYSQQFKRNFDIGVAFKMNPYILDCSKTESEGTAFILSILKQLWVDHAYIDALYFMGQSFSKFLGYKLGLHYQLIPQPLIKKFTMNKEFWDKSSRRSELL